MNDTKPRGVEAFGCDIGNGFGFISLLEKETQNAVSMFPAKYRLKDGMPTTAHIVPPDGEKIEIFDFARGGAQKATRKNPERGISAVKTRLKEEYIRVKGIDAPVSLDRVYATIVRDLVILANEERAARGQTPLYELVMTFPASFSENLTLLNRMQNSVEAITVDGHALRVVGRLPEPAAVAIDYLYYVQNVAKMPFSLREEGFTVLVYDLGHGTFDAALVTAKTQGEPYEVLAKQGHPEIGGKNFDALLYDEICTLLEKEYSYIPKNEREKEELRYLTVEMKHGLSDSENYTIRPQLSGGGYAEITITRDRLEEMITPLVNQTLEIASQMLDDAKARNIPVDCIVLSGGASRMPMIMRSLEMLTSGELPVMRYRPSEAVSFGASRYASGLSPVVGAQAAWNEPQAKECHPKNAILNQYTEYPCGIFREKKGSLNGEIRIVLGSGVKLPATSQTFALMSESPRLQLRINRSLNKNLENESAPLAECPEIVRMTFDVEPNVVYRFCMTVEEDYNISVLCTAADGTVQRKSTADLIGIK